MTRQIAIAGFVIGCVTPKTGVRYFAMFTFAISTYAVNSILHGWPGSTWVWMQRKEHQRTAFPTSSPTASFIWALSCIAISADTMPPCPHSTSGRRVMSHGMWSPWAPMLVSHLRACLVPCTFRIGPSGRFTPFLMQRLLQHEWISPNLESLSTASRSHLSAK